MEEVLENQKQYGLDKNPDLTNIDIEVDHRGVGCHPMHRVHVKTWNEHLSWKL